MRQQNFKGPKLPKELLNQFAGDPHHSNGSRGPRPPSTRKERRKAEREQKKAHRNHVKPKHENREKQSRRASVSEKDETVFAEELSPPPPNPAVQQKDRTQQTLKSILKKTTQQDSRSIFRRGSPSSSPPPRPSRAVRDKLAEDEAEIAALEKKLGLKGKNSKKVADDGLDDLLDGLDDLESEDEAFGSGSSKRKRPADDNWLANKRRKALGVDEIPSGSEESEHDLEDETNTVSDQEADVSDALGSSSDFDGFASEEVDRPSQPRVRENPYVAPVSLNDTSIAKYVPPSLRGPPTSDVEALSRLKKQLQGLLNRLSEANLLTILRDVEQIYQSNARGYVNSTLVDLLIGLLADESILMDTFLILHAGFITAVYKVIGTDFGAQMVERIVSESDLNYNNPQMRGGKKPTNLISLLAELYNFQVIGSNLVFDYIRLFLHELSDLNTELLLRVIRISGPQLRQDDPSSLKDIVLLLQRSVAKIGENNLSVRTKFMIESINNLKNNRVKTGIDASAIVSEHTVRMKKTLGTLNTRNLKGTEPLRIGLDDIRDTDKKGKWWLVGASWRNDCRQNDDSSGIANKQKYLAESETVEHEDGSTDLLQLARENRMNTDIRRAIFITILSATDFKDAHMRLLKLNLRKSQELEIPRVLTHCAGSEQNYNPYYTLIARRLCSEHKLKKAFQFTLWDIFKNLGEKNAEDDLSEEDDSNETISTRKVVNLGRMYGTLIANGGLPISCLKTLNFPYLQPKTKTFVEIVVVTAILQSQQASINNTGEKALLNIFTQVDTAPQMVRGLQFFLKKVVAKGDIAGGKADRETVRWACKLLVESLTGLATAKVDDEN